MGNLWPSALLKFTVARLFLEKGSLKSQKDWVFLKNVCHSRMMLLKAELKKVCCCLSTGCSCTSPVQLSVWSYTGEGR